MAEQPLQYCAIHYANQWFGTDKEYCKVLASGSRTQQRDALKKAGAFYRVARNFQTKFDEERGDQRFDRLIDMLARVQRQPFINDTAGRVQAFADRLSQHYGGYEVTSGASKFLWLKLKSPIVIYDANVRKGLRLKANCEYAAYLERWKSEYDNLSGRIDRACRELVNVRGYVYNSNVLSEQKFRMLTEKRWFKERVLDMFLWFRGA